MLLFICLQLQFVVMHIRKCILLQASLCIRACCVSCSYCVRLLEAFWLLSAFLPHLNPSKPQLEASVELQGSLHVSLLYLHFRSFLCLTHPAWRVEIKIQNKHFHIKHLFMCVLVLFHIKCLDVMSEPVLSEHSRNNALNLINDEARDLVSKWLYIILQLVIQLNAKNWQLGV